MHVPFLCNSLIPRSVTIPKGAFVFQVNNELINKEQKWRMDVRRTLPHWVLRRGRGLLWGLETDFRRRSFGGHVDHPIWGLVPPHYQLLPLWIAWSISRLQEALTLVAWERESGRNRIGAWAQLAVLAVYSNPEIAKVCRLNQIIALMWDRSKIKVYGTSLLMGLLHLSWL